MVIEILAFRRYETQSSKREQDDFVNLEDW